MGAVSPSNTEGSDIASSDISGYDLDAILKEVDERGYVLIPNVLEDDVVAGVRQIYMEIAQGEKSQNSSENGHQRIISIATKHPIFLEIMCHPLTVALWRRYLGEDMVCSTWTGNTLWPGHDSYGWHADYPYWSFKPPWPADYNIAAQTIWLLDDLTEENGATGVVPFSHRRGHPPDGDSNKWRDDAERLTAPAGSVIVAHGAFWHTSSPNLSEASRSVILGMYCRAYCITQEPMREQLAMLDHPSELVSQLMCANQHTPRSPRTHT